MQAHAQNVPGPTRDLVGYGAHPPKVRWPQDAALALNIVVNYEEGSEYAYPSGDERNDGLGEIAYTMPDGYRDLAVESTYEYGSRVGIWRLLRLFEEYDVKSTFFTCAVALDRNRPVAAAMHEQGHECCSHGYRWEEQWLLSRDEERERIAAAYDLFTEIVGEPPTGWYCRYGPSVHTRELVVEHGGFQYDADAYNDDLPYFTEVKGTSHLVVPYSLTYNDVRFGIAPGFGGIGDFVDICRRGIDEFRREGLAGAPKMMSIGLHPRLIGQPGRLSGLREVIEYAAAQGDVWFARRDEIAAWWQAHHEEFAG
jgi:peptidoglycan/xylan/chitin deacetylase (PgdA/CDA1 family)